MGARVVIVVASSCGGPAWHNPTACPLLNLRWVDNRWEDNAPPQFGGQ